MARELGFTKAMHVDLAPLAEDDFDWENFAFKEELIRFRYAPLPFNLC